MVRFLLLLLIVYSFTSCGGSSNNQVKETKQDKDLDVFIQPDTIMLGEEAILTIQRNKFMLPRLRGVFGNFDENFELPENEVEYYFQDTDSVATLVLIPELPGHKLIRGFIEEYRIIGEDSIDSYRHKFQEPLFVKDTSDIISL